MHANAQPSYQRIDGSHIKLIINRIINRHRQSGRLVFLLFRAIAILIMLNNTIKYS